MIGMLENLETRQGLPVEMQTLLRDYPRDAWPDHPNFAASIQNWLGAHVMFGRLADIVEKDTQTQLDRNSDLRDYVGRLGHFGNLLVANLHGHHTWEDRNYFPELSRADPRFDGGLQMLEADHEVLDAGLQRLTEHANRTIQLATLDPKQVREQAALVLQDVRDVKTYLGRHLPDEEDLIVPILLHHKMRG
ncbi:hemerythrin domain-containing protein [Amylibacter sp. IMCC11727]|uniref:hemerythrin domain-containing protein n=1 Tax=Amylibacter sp. IMCC11727 TaxID=3039851 RepID=UPI00244DF0A2|nr:hemerythrin domain-containing protein [Amylibacter sp. IMCC11727]WGI20818.1 hemerythrin domain-containing protein [Amylibacter sp. IMCC11727]